MELENSDFNPPFYLIDPKIDTTINEYKEVLKKDRVELSSFIHRIIENSYDSLREMIKR